MRYECVKAKSLLSKPHVAEGWFHMNRSLNAYRGCEHGCVYCDGNSEYYHVDNFYSRIQVKENAAQVLRKELKKIGFTSRSELETETLWKFLDDEDAKRIAEKVPRKIVIGVCGGVSDGFQQAEQVHKVTYRILESLLDYGLPVFILTKSTLVLEYLDLLKEINERAFANVVFTITCADDSVQSVFEPKAASTSERFDALKEIRKAGLFGGVMATPIIPTIGDNVENMTSLVKKTKATGGEFIQFGGMTLKPGRQKEYFMRVIKRRYQENYDLIERIYENNNTYGQPIWKRLPVNVMVMGHHLCKQHGVRDRSVRHKIPYEYESNNRVLAVLLDIVFRMNMFFGMSRSATKPYWELAARIERGVDELAKLRSEGELEERLMINDTMGETVNEILDSGTCRVLENLETRIDTMANMEIDSDIRTSPDEFV
ncbi:MAG: radical SAM protein [Candidatus Thorarchaeota archaeon]|nr:radical SAM protein [Candidatus Thorarchaeota archaeon]